MGHIDSNHTHTEKKIHSPLSLLLFIDLDGLVVLEKSVVVKAIPNFYKERKTKKHHPSRAEKAKNNFTQRKKENESINRSINEREREREKQSCVVCDDESQSIKSKIDHTHTINNNFSHTINTQRKKENESIKSIMRARSNAILKKKETK